MNLLNWGISNFRTFLAFLPHFGQMLYSAKCRFSQLLFRQSVMDSINMSECFSCLQQIGIRYWKRWKYQAPVLVFRNTYTIRLHWEIIETDWNMMKIDSVKWTETWKKLTKSKRFSCFETKLKQALEKVKNQAPFLVFRNTETINYKGKLLKRTETWRKLIKSKRFSCLHFSCFETFQNKIETSSGNGENTRLHFWCFETLKTMGLHVYREIIETDWNMKEISEVQIFQLFWHKMETSTWKGENTRPHFWCFEMLKQWDYMYIGKLLKRTETWRKLVKSKRFSCFDTKWKQALEKVKIPCPISGVLKYWNNKII